MCVRGCRKSGFDPLGSVGLPKAPFDPLGSVGLPREHMADTAKVDAASEPQEANARPDRQRDAARGAAGPSSRAPSRLDQAPSPAPLGRAGGELRGAAGGVRKSERWQDKVDFDLLSCAVASLSGGPSVPNAAALQLDGDFWARIEGLKDAMGVQKLQQRVLGLEGVIEKLWGRFALFKADGVEGVRLQNELRGLQAKLGAGADVETALEERERLKVKVSQADSQAAELAGKMKLLEGEMKEYGALLEDARRESEDRNAKLRAEKRAREASEDACRTLESERDDLQRELRDAKDGMAAERRELKGLRGDLNKVKDIRVSWLSQGELDDLFRRHDRDNSGDISAEEMKPFVEEVLVRARARCITVECPLHLCRVLAASL